MVGPMWLQICWGEGKFLFNGLMREAERGW